MNREGSGRRVGPPTRESKIAGGASTCETVSRRPVANTARVPIPTAVVAIDRSIDPRSLPGPMRAADVRLVDANDLEAIDGWDDLDGCPVALVVRETSHAETVAITHRIVRRGGDVTGVHRFGAYAP